MNKKAAELLDEFVEKKAKRVADRMTLTPGRHGVDRPIDSTVVVDKPWYRRNNPHNFKVLALSSLYKVDPESVKSLKEMDEESRKLKVIEIMENAAKEQKGLVSYRAPEPLLFGKRRFNEMANNPVKTNIYTSPDSYERIRKDVEDDYLYLQKSPKKLYEAIKNNDGRNIFFVPPTNKEKNASDVLDKKAASTLDEWVLEKHAKEKKKGEYEKMDKKASDILDEWVTKKEASVKRKLGQFASDFSGKNLQRAAQEHAKSLQNIADISHQPGWLQRGIWDDLEWAARNSGSKKYDAHMAMLQARYNTLTGVTGAAVVADGIKKLKKSSLSPFMSTFRDTEKKASIKRKFSQLAPNLSGRNFEIARQNHRKAMENFRNMPSTVNMSPAALDAFDDVYIKVRRAGLSEIEARDAKIIAVEKAMRRAHGVVDTGILGFLGHDYLSGKKLAKQAAYSRKLPLALGAGAAGTVGLAALKKKNFYKGKADPYKNSFQAASELTYGKDGTGEDGLFEESIQDITKGINRELATHRYKDSPGNLQQLNKQFIVNRYRNRDKIQDEVRKIEQMDREIAEKVKGIKSFKDTLDFRAGGDHKAIKREIDRLLQSSKPMTEEERKKITSTPIKRDYK